MKKHIFLLLCCTICALRATAQFTPKSVLLEGNFNYFTTFKAKDAPSGTKTPYNFFIGTSAGLFINRRNELGVGLNLGIERSSFDGIGSINVDYSRSFGYSLFWRNYVPLNEKLSYASGVSISNTFSRYRFDEQDADLFRLRQFGLNFTPSLVYRITPKLGLRGSIGGVGLNFSKVKDIGEWSRSLQLNFRPQNINFGIFLLLNQ
jgi:hypothetical protein